MMQKLYLFFTLFLFLSLTVNAQTKKDFADAIEDNSFLIEEAYNQENSVVQHISNGIYKTDPTKDFFYIFTQEWPVGGVDHQLSYSIPYLFVDGNSHHGLGDIMLNYRYQLFYKEDWACVSPRLSIILPTGNYQNGLGMNVPGFQFNLPVSKRISDYWVAHLNAGYTYYALVKGGDSLTSEVKRNLSFWNYGGSVIWLTNKNFNVMLEFVRNISSEIDASGKVRYNNETIINPGLRGAIDVGKLQIVPGISVPVSFANSTTHTGIFFYLSFEHPF